MVERKSDKFDVTGSNPVSYKKATRLENNREESVNFGIHL